VLACVYVMCVHVQGGGVGVYIEGEALWVDRGSVFTSNHVTTSGSTCGGVVQVTENGRAQLTGTTIDGNYMYDSSGDPSGEGAAICTNTATSLTMDNCVVSSNVASDIGGVRIRGNATLRNVVFRNTTGCVGTRTSVSTDVSVALKDVRFEECDGYAIHTTVPAELTRVTVLGGNATRYPVNLRGPTTTVLDLHVAGVHANGYTSCGGVSVWNSVVEFVGTSVIEDISIGSDATATAGALHVEGGGSVTVTPSATLTVRDSSSYDAEVGAGVLLEGDSKLWVLAGAHLNVQGNVGDMVRCGVSCFLFLLLWCPQSAIRVAAYSIQLACVCVCVCVCVLLAGRGNICIGHFSDWRGGRQCCHSLQHGENPWWRHCRL
jgi:hypothetical protein